MSSCPPGRTCNKEYYLEVKRRLHEAIRRKRPWICGEMTHGNCNMIMYLVTIHCQMNEFLAKNNTIMMPQHPYSLDMAPCDFFLFLKMKTTMKGQRFASIEEIKTESLKELNAIPKIAFQKCFEDWKKCWHKCIIFDGDYFEGDKIKYWWINKDFFDKNENSAYLLIQPRVVKDKVVSYIHTTTIQNCSK